MKEPTNYFYQVRRSQWGWARLWITSDWCLTIMSDWGSFSYWWSPDPYDFREFLCSRDDTDYLANKFSRGEQEIDEAATTRWIQERICRERREQRLTREKARQEWELVQGIDFSDEGDRQHWYNHTKLDDAWDALRYRTPMRVQMFLRHCWPLLMVEMRRQLGEPLRQRARGWLERSAA